MAAFPNIGVFYAARGGERSGECDFGVWWRNRPPQGRGPYFRVSVVHDTGDVYAFNQWDQSVDLLGTLPADCPSVMAHRENCPYEIAEALFAGWTDAVRDETLDFFRNRLESIA